MKEKGSSRLPLLKSIQRYLIHNHDGPRKDFSTSEKRLTTSKSQSLSLKKKNLRKRRNLLLSSSKELMRKMTMTLILRLS